MATSIRVRSISLAALFALLLAQPAFAQDKPDPKELVIGDWYTEPFELHLKSDPFPTTGEHSGYLVKATDDWIVLSCIRSEGRVRGVPWVSELPYVGSMFRTETQVIRKVTMWVPRTSAKITDRKHFTDQPDKKDFQHDEPKLEGECEVGYHDEKGDSIASGKVTAVVDGRLRILRRVRTSTPSGSKTVVETVETEINLDKIVFVRQQVPFEIANAQRKETMN